MKQHFKAAAAAAAFCIALSGLSSASVAHADPTPPPTQGSTSATQAAAWISAQLAANGDVISGPLGQTLDAIFALASAGVGGDQLAATAAKVYASDTAYIGTTTEITTKWSAIAKTILGLEVAGLDATVFPTTTGPRNLVDDLRSVLNENGSFGKSDSPFSHSLALMALARTDAGVPKAAVEWIKQQQCADPKSANLGAYGWGSGCNGADADATALAIQGLEAAKVASSDASIAEAKKWLASQQTSSGGFAAFGLANTNSTGVTAQAMKGDATVTKRAAAFITGLQITCDDVMAEGSKLTQGDVGAITYNQDAYDATIAQGMTDGTRGQSLYASVQAVLGLGGPTFANLTAHGMQPGLPDLTCGKDEPPVEPSVEPPVEPSKPAPSDPSSPDTSATPTVKPSATTAPTVVHGGGHMMSSTAPALLAGVAALLVGVVVLKRRIALR